MKRLVVLGIVFASAVAHADTTYYGMGMGGGATLEGDLAAGYDASGHAAGRFVLGRRSGPWALEGSFFGTDLTERGSGEMLSTLSLGVDLKYHLALTEKLELYVKGGLNTNSMEGYEGRGYAYGTGLQYNVHLLGNWSAALWLDLNRQVVRMHGDEGAQSLDGGLEMVTFGFSFSR